MTRIEDEYHRTLVALLINTNQRELASAMIDGGIDFMTHGDINSGPTGLYVDVPASAYSLITGNHELRDTLVAAAATVADGRFSDGYGNVITADIAIRLKLVEVEKDWQAVARELIINFKGNNQGAVSKLMAERNSRQMIIYNEAQYASRSEVRIAQELERRGVLFFPLAMAIRAETGENWKDHREADFLVCDDGIWGVLEVCYHPDRYEQDKEKDAWWKQSGILCIEHYTAERCFNESARIVTEFLTILSKHRR
ncbi:MAG TPA: hypothetical protein VF595_14720 [Tepidisphaeraceae bacterium]|jgi:hypothetical protein